MSERARANGHRPADVLLLYHITARGDASTIREHVDAIVSNSAFTITAVNTEYGFPRVLERTQFQAVILHWSLFGTENYLLPPPFLDLLTRHAGAFRGAFFQDEMQNTRQRYAFINAFELDCVWTLLDPAHWPAVYQKYTRARRLVYTLTGFVGDAMLKAAGRFAKPDAERSIDVGYRARRLPRWMGRGALEKAEIGETFKQRAAGSGLRLDIELDEGHRLYGNAWHQFLGDSRSVLGVESGVSVFDADGTLREELGRRGPGTPSFDEATFVREVLDPREEVIPYRTVSPRHFEAAAFRCLQVLYEGTYSGVLTPGKHYVPLRKDWSNFDDVLAVLRDAARRTEITNAAYDDLIASGAWSDAHFVREFDGVLRDAGLVPTQSRLDGAALAAAVGRDQRVAYLPIAARAIASRAYGAALDSDYPGKRAIAGTLRAAVRLVRRARGSEG